MQGLLISQIYRILYCYTVNQYIPMLSFLIHRRGLCIIYVLSEFKKYFIAKAKVNVFQRFRFVAQIRFKRLGF